MNPARKCLVHCLCSIGGKKQNAIVVFELAQEDANERIPVDVIGRPPLHEDIGFIQKQGGLPMAR